MKIHSKFSDYYDSALAYGQDETLHFVRETEIVKCPKEIIEKLETNWKYPNVKTSAIMRSMYQMPSFGTGFIFFCGKIYSFVKKSDVHGVSYLFPCVIGWNTINEMFGSSRIKQFFGEQVSNYKKALSFIDTVNLNEFSIQENLPYFAVESRYITATPEIALIKTPCLKDYGFQKVIDPYTAMQELSMYLGGVIPRQTPEIVQISDKDRVVQHGFDKHSFRSSKRG